MRTQYVFNNYYLFKKGDIDMSNFNGNEPDSKKVVEAIANNKKTSNSRNRKNGGKFRKEAKGVSAKGSSYSGGFNKFYHDMFNNAGDLGKSSNSFPFANVAGFPIWYNSNAIHTDSGLQNGSKIHLPSLMVLESVLTPGYSGDNSSALNVAANKLFAEMRRYNTSVEVYDSVDVMEYILACDMAFAIHSYFASAYALLNNMEWSNRFIPRALCEARGFDYDDLAIHQTELRNALNTFRVQMGALNIPNAFAFMNYHAQMYSNVYKDADNFRAQLYSVIPHVYYVFQEGATGDEPGKLVPKAFPIVDENIPGQKARRKLRVSDIDRILKEIVTPLTTSGSFSLISGDMLKLTDFSMLSVDEVTESTVATPVYDPEFLRDLKNATIYMNTAVQPEWKIPTSTYDAETNCYCIEQTPDVGGIRFQPAIKGLSVASDVIIDIESDLPSPEDFYVATRHTTLGTKPFIATETGSDGTKYTYAVTNPEVMGFDYYVSGTVYSFKVSGNTATELNLGTKAPGINDDAKLVSSATNITTDFVIDTATTADTHVSQEAMNKCLKKITTLSKFSAIPRMNLFVRQVSKNRSFCDFIDILNDVYNISAIAPTKLLDSTSMTYYTAYSLVRK